MTRGTRLQPVVCGERNMLKLVLGRKRFISRHGVAACAGLAGGGRPSPVSGSCTEPAASSWGRQHRRLSVGPGQQPPTSGGLQSTGSHRDPPEAGCPQRRWQTRRHVGAGRRKGRGRWACAALGSTAPSSPFPRPPERSPWSRSQRHSTQRPVGQWLQPPARKRRPFPCRDCPVSPLTFSVS